MRLAHLVVGCALVAAAAYVYKFKFDSTLQVERIAKLRAEIRRERDAIAGLRAEWSQLDNPDRIQGLAQRHLPLRPVDQTQFDAIERLPERPRDAVVPLSNDPIGTMIENSTADIPTGAVGARRGGR